MKDNGMAKGKAPLQKIYKCSHCDKEFKYASEIRRHEKSHFAEFQCKVCNKCFSYISALRRHEQQHMRKDHVLCTICNKKFRDENLLKRHKEYTHKSKGMYKCEKCESTFNSRIALKNHMKTHVVESERRYKCKYANCSKSFNFFHHMKNHELTHSDTKQYFCDICQKGFIQAHHLKTHMMKHRPNEWVSCTEANCEKRFPTKYARDRHMATHKKKYTGENKGSTDYAHVVGDDTKCSQNFIENHYFAIHDSNYGIHESLNKLNVPEHSLHKETYKCSEHNKKISTHCKQCNIRESDNILEDVEIDNSELSINMIDKKDDTVTVDIRASDKPKPVEYSEQFDDTLNSCNTVLGGCLETGSDMNDSCPCAQIQKKSLYNEDSNNRPEIRQLIKNAILNKSNNKTCDTSGKLCKPKMVNGCCSSMPIIKTNSEGIIKLAETFDTDIDIIQYGADKSINKKNKNTYQDNILIPFNSCKEVLGNCIVSGNDTIGAECICAKMSLDIQQATPQEIEEISIYESNN